MRFSQLLNPKFVFRNRELIVPYLERHWKFGPLKNCHKGQRCFVLGNGPSLRISDLDQLKTEITFASNKIYLAFSQTEWRPTYYVVEDNNMIRENRDEICGIKGPLKFVQLDWRHLFEGEPGMIFYNYSSVSPDEFPKFGDPLQFLYCGFMVTYISLQLAYFMGFSHVYLLGIDFDYSLVGSGTGPIVEHSVADPQDHFLPNYFRTGEKRALPVLDRAEEAMRYAGDQFALDGRKIWNATRGGKLEVFDRISFEEVLAKS